MDTLKVKNFGPIQEANVEFGDFTLLVGPQASGKSIFLQLFKLVADNNYITNTLNKYGYNWNNNAEFLDRYLGEGMSQVWTDKTKIIADGKEFRNKDLATIIPDASGYERENVFYIPAQRVLTLENGWPRPFKSFAVSDPFSIKNFSESIRLYVELGGDVIFREDHSPLKETKSYKDIFYTSEIVMDKSGPTKRIVLKMDSSQLPYMVWSTGQKESMPLHLSFFFLKYPSLTLTGVTDITVVIEEPEMGLHPAAIKSMIVDFLYLISIGYKLVISTHSPVLLEFVWAVRMLKENNADSTALRELFEMKEIGPFDEVFEKTMKYMDFKTYFFDKGDGIVKDISSLDAGSENPDIAEWGGLSSFASRAGEIVSKNIPL